MGDSRLEAITDKLPVGFNDLRAAARAEGHRFLDRLATDWSAGTMRFDRPGELLLAVFVEGEFVGFGGITTEAAMPKALRMRRFYVLPSHRRSGVGRRLASALLEHGKAVVGPVTVNTQSESFGFWESLGFVRLKNAGLTHSKGLHVEAAR